MKTKILVTGGAGFIGSHTVVELVVAGYEVVIIDNLSNSLPSALDGIAEIIGYRPAFYEGDVADEAFLSRVFKENPDIKGAIHFAASKAVGESVKKPLLYYRNNINSLISLLGSLTQCGSRGLVFSSSCTVYGEPEHSPIDESAPVRPATSPYGNTKQICEEIITDYLASGVPLNAVLLRYFNPVGAHPSAKIGELPLGVPANLVPYLTQAAAGIRKELTVFGNNYATPDGTCIRDYIDVCDLARAHVKAVERLINSKESGNLEIFNLGTGNGLSVLDLINAFEEATGVKVPYKFGERREGDIVSIWADPKKANEVLGWKAETDIRDTMRNAWRWQQHTMAADPKGGE